MRSNGPALLLLLASAPWAQAADHGQLLRSDYQTLWRGYTSVATCLHDQDQYPLGAFVFVCDQYTFDYPYHYGEVTLLARQGSSIGYLCLSEDQDCLKGTIYRR